MSEGTMMTTAATANDDASSQAVATPPATGQQAAGSQGGDAQQQSGANGQTAAAPPAAAKPEGEPSAATAAPVNYEFTMPEGIELAKDSAELTAFTEFAKENNLTQEQAQSLFSKFAPRVQAHNASVLETAQQKWEGEVRNNKEFGGDKLNQSLAVAGKALNQFGSPELNKLLAESRMGSHPEVVGLFYRIGLTLKEDDVIKGGTSTPSRDFASALYPNQPH